MIYSDALRSGGGSCWTSRNEINSSVARWGRVPRSGRHATEIAEHEHCRRIAGDDSTPPPFAVAIPSPARFDAEVHPTKLHTILPCDSSQLEAILAINSGTSLVLDRPPGTGKSQTIANVIAECLADGKTVLFVSEKAAALEVVKQRLGQRNLGDFALNRHSHKASKKEIVTELGRWLNLPCEEYVGRDGDLERLDRQRERLNSYVRALHGRAVQPLACPTMPSSSSSTELPVSSAIG